MNLLIVEKDLIIHCGETSWGGDGFVAVTHENGKLIWIAFFDYSNPMVRVEWIDSKVIAHSNLGNKWIFDIDKPEEVRVQVDI